MLSNSDRPFKLGVALSGGGARGFAHAGALQALEEVGLKPDILAGVSAGSVIAVLYASGVKPRYMLPLFSDIKFSTCCELAFNNGGVFKIDKFVKFLKKNLREYQTIESLKIKTLVCATDFDLGRAVAFDHGNAAERVGASCSIPVLFHPFKIDGTHYVDGGVIRNLPAWAIREQCQTLIGINCSPMVEARFKPSVVDVALRAYRFMAKHNTDADCAMCDILVETTDLANYRTFNMREIERVFQSGYDATLRAIDQHPDLLKQANIGK